MTEKKEKTIYELELHEGLKLTSNLGPVEITRVPGGWVYCFDYPGFRQSQIVFVPYSGGDYYAESAKRAAKEADNEKKEEVKAKKKK